ncbi:phosphoribosylaminoimidazole carboxylase ade2 [Mortierella sp. AD094]|nr:phosphoribosylaminoimidazole carboxylase ade2 [Mortierella sp. AD094]
MPERMYRLGRTAQKRGTKVIIAGAGGAALLPGMVAALTSLPVIGVTIHGIRLDRVDPFYAICTVGLVDYDLSAWCLLATVAISNSTDAALLAVHMFKVVSKMRFLASLQ